MQMSMSKPVGPDMATATPLGPPRAQTAQEQHAGLLELDAQPSVASIRLPEGAATEGLCPVRAAKNGHLVFGSNNFRSPNTCEANLGDGGPG
jgi:hypothetical protein